MLEEDFVQHMRHAINLAKKGRFAVQPNPMVGAVLVQNGLIVAEGWHKKYGENHAEVECLQDAAQKGVDVSSCTMVVTLEPCKHYGKTPPCVDAIIKAGIKRVVIGTLDPTPEAGGGAEILRAQGIEVLVGVEENSSRDLLAEFLVLKNSDRPYVILKMASTLDGRIGTRTGHSKWISCEVSRNEVQELRKNIARCGGAILIGGGTFRLDDPHLDVRYDDTEDGKGPQPLACVVTSRIMSNALGNYLIKERPTETIFYTSPAAAASPMAKSLENLGVRLWSESPNNLRLPPLEPLLRRLREETQCSYVLCEGGGKLALSMLEQGLVDEFHLYLAPCILGDNEATPIFDGKSPMQMGDALAMRVTDYGMSGIDIRVILRPKLCSQD